MKMKQKVVLSLNRWKIRGRVTFQSNIREFHGRNGLTEVISFDIQDYISKQERESVGQIMPSLIEQLEGKERNLFFHFLILLQKCWPKLNQKQMSDDDDINDVFNICLDLLALAMLHEHLDRNQRRKFLLTCLNEEKTT